jgi:hypothetical protein
MQSITQLSYYVIQKPSQMPNQLAYSTEDSQTELFAVILLSLALLNLIF